jgi:hypothetical protein
VIIQSGAATRLSNSMTSQPKAARATAKNGIIGSTKQSMNAGTSRHDAMNVPSRRTAPMRPQPGLQPEWRPAS